MSVSLGARLKELIKEKNLEQQQIAFLIGLKTPTFNGYVSDKREPNINTLIKIADFFQVSVDYLIGRTNIRGSFYTLPNNLQEFVCNPENKIYLELALDIKNRTEVPLNSKLIAR